MHPVAGMPIVGIRTPNTLQTGVGTRRFARPRFHQHLQARQSSYGSIACAEGKAIFYFDIGQTFVHSDLKDGVYALADIPW